jgi:inner membrane protein YidH
MKRQFKKLITFTKDYQNKEDIILRDHLAMERTKLANERTLLSYLRTSLYLLLGGIALLGLKDFQDLKFLGYIALSLSALLIIVGTIRFLQLKKQLERFYVPINNNENN